MSSTLEWLRAAYFGVGGLLLLIFVWAETVGRPDRPCRRSLLELARTLPVAIPLLGLLWPLLFALVGYRLWHERARSRACHDYPAVPGPLTEAGWRAATDPATVLLQLAPRLKERQRLLLGAALCRRVWQQAHDARSREAVLAVERSAAGLAGPGELVAATRAAAAAAGDLAEGRNLRAAAAARACLDAARSDPAGAAHRALYAAGWGWRAERRVQLDLVRDIVGDPFRPLRPRAFPPHVRALADLVGLGEEDLRPVLADSLAELGEVAAAEHLRRPGHQRGCHVLEWVLGHG